MIKQFFSEKEKLEHAILEKSRDIKQLQWNIFMKHGINIGEPTYTKDDVEISYDENTIMVTFKKTGETLGFTAKYFDSDDWIAKKTAIFEVEAEELKNSLEKQSQVTTDRELKMLESLVKKYPLDTKQFLNNL